MTTESSYHHTRADSGVGSMNPIPKNFDNLKKFWEAISSLANGEDFETLGDLIKYVSFQEDEFRKKEEEVRELKMSLSAQKKSHETFNQEQLSLFEERYHRWQEINSVLRSEAEYSATAFEEKDKQMEALQKELNNHEVQVGDLENAYSEMTKSLNEKDQQLRELKTRLQTAEIATKDHVEKLKKAQSDTNNLKNLLKDETKRHQALQAEFEKMKGKLQEFQQFSVRTKDLDLTAVASKLDFMWKSVTALVVDFFGQDLSVEVLQTDWRKLRENELFKHQIPLPQSNSDIAKQMRVAVIVGSIAKLVDKFLFQPNYLLEEGSDLRKILRKEATINPKKELYIRGILLSMVPEDQEEYSEESPDFIVEDLLGLINVQVLLTPDNRSTFAGKLRDLMSNLQKQWNIIQHGKQKLEPSFTANPTTTELPWYVLDLRAAVEDRNRPSAPLTATDAQDGTVVIPRVYHMKPGTSPDPITHGWVLPKANMNAAAAEIRKGLPNTPFAEGTSSRSRNRPGRSLSISANDKPNGHRGGRFLS